jgi:SAM-dependent methyltransferase
MTVRERARGVLRRIHRQPVPAKKAGRENLLREFVPDGIGVEVGTWKGRFAARLLTRAKPRTLHLVDPWQFRSEEAYGSAHYGGRAEGGQAEVESIYQGVLTRFAGEISDGIVVVHRMTSKEAVGLFDDDSLDWVYIDGDHHYDAVKADLQLWYPKVRPGGLLAGDDLDTGNWWQDDVARAVREFAADPETPPLSVLGSQFCFRK